MKSIIPWAKPVLLGKERGYLNQAVDSTWISGGPFVEKFEKEFNKHIKSPYGVTTSNGTTALHLALLALGIGPGDEVVVPAFTFVGPVNMVIAVGATPVYADVDPQTWCLDPASVAKNVTQKTKAIIAVHTYGNVCDMDALNEIAKTQHLFLIEDTAEAAFSKYKGKFAGTCSDIGCFSFQATKTITMGEGGFVATPDAALYERMRLIRDHGMRKDKRYWHDVVGYNFRLTNLQAAVGCAQLEEVDRISSERARVYSCYKEHLSQSDGITLQYFSQDVEPVVWAIAIKLNPKVYPDRDLLIKRFLDKGIETRPGFYPCSVLPIYKAPKLPVSEEVGLQVISLPSFPSLTEEEISFICDQLKKCKI